MADYVNCPTCHGRGVIPVEDAAAIEVHASVERSEAQQLQRQREQEMVQERLASRQADAAARQQRLEALILGKRDRMARGIEHVASGNERTPEEIAELRERLARLEADQGGTGS